MEILIGVAVFLVWYLVGLLTGLYLYWPIKNNRDVLLLTTISIGGPVSWLVVLIYCRMLWQRV